MYSVCTLLKVVGYYDLSVLSMSVMGFNKKSLNGGWVGGWGELNPFFWGIIGIVLTLQSPLETPGVILALIAVLSWYVPS